MKTFSKVFCTLILIYAPFVLSGCGEEQPLVPKEDQSQYAALERDAAQRTLWIERMEPFVAKLSDETYRLEWDSFIKTTVFEEKTHASLNGEGPVTADAKIITELRDGITTGNLAILREQAGLGVLGSACWTYWWGRRCCYWGNQAWAMVSIMAGGGVVPPLSLVLTPYAAWAGYYTQVYGGFCVNGSWAGGIWLTKP